MTVRSTLAAVVVALLTAALVPLGTGAAVAAVCPQPRFVTTAPHGRWSTQGYWVDNDVWNGAGYAVRQRLSACGHDRWRVAVRIGRPRNTWSVKTYPNVHRDWHDWSTGAEPRLSRFRALRSSFRAHAPAAGIHNLAYDVWLGGAPGAPGVREVMVWTSARGMRPAGHVVRRGVRLGGRTWTVWSSADDSYVAFVPRHGFSAGRVLLLAHLHWLQRHHRLPASTTLSQVGFGFEVISTAGRRQTFSVRDFAIHAA